jgi:hypothetical protein
VDDHSEILTSFTQIKEAKLSSSSKRSIVSTVSSGITWKSRMEISGTGWISYIPIDVAHSVNAVLVLEQY